MKRGIVLFDIYKKKALEEAEKNWRNFAKFGHCDVYREKSIPIHCDFCPFNSEKGCGKPNEYYKNLLNENEKWRDILKEYSEKMLEELKKTWNEFMKCGDCGGNKTVPVECDYCPIFDFCAEKENSNKNAEYLNEEV